MNSTSRKLVRRIFSKTKVKKTSFSNMAAVSDFEIKNLRNALEESQTTIDAMLQQMAEINDAKKQISNELRNEQYSFMKLHQQLEDERNLYVMDKKQLCNEIHHLRTQLGYKSSEESAHKKQVIDHNHQICDICIKFLRMKKTKQKLKENFVRSEKDAEQYVNKLNARIEELSEALLESKNVGQFSRPYIKSIRRYLELQYDNRCLQRKLQLLKRHQYGLSMKDFTPQPQLIHQSSMTDLSNGKNITKKNVEFSITADSINRRKRRPKNPASKISATKTDTSRSESTLNIKHTKTPIYSDLISFTECDSKSLQDSNSVAQLPVTECTSTSYFKLTRFTSTHTVNSAATEVVVQKGEGRARGAMRTQSAPDIVTGRDFEDLNHQFTCYMKDTGTNT